MRKLISLRKQVGEVVWTYILPQTVSVIKMLIVYRVLLKTLPLVNVKMGTVEMELIAQVYIYQGFYDGYFNYFPLLNVDIDECATNMSPCVEDSICVNTNGSYYCVCCPGYSCEEENYNCTGNKLLEGDFTFSLCTIFFLMQISTSVLWIYTTVPKTILNVSTLSVVIIASACQATRASSVTVMAVFYTVYFCYLAKSLQILMSVLWISTTVMKMLCASILLAVTHACVIMATWEMEPTVNHVILIILFQNLVLLKIAQVKPW